MEIFILSEDPNNLRLQCRGHITQSLFNGESDPFDRIINTSALGLARSVQVDLGLTDWIDSSGIGWLLRCHNKTKQAGGTLSIQNIPPRIAEVLRFCKLDRILNFLPEPKIAATK